MNERNEPKQSRVPACRIQDNGEEARAEGKYVLYWMTAARRTHFNFGLERAVEWARHTKRPLVVLEALRVGYPHASDRLHAFILQGMADNAKTLQTHGITHLVYVERQKDEGKGLLETLAEDACVVITDEFPAFFLPRMLKAAQTKITKIRLESVDSNGLLPIHEPKRIFTTAFSFRAYLQKNLLQHLQFRPLADPLLGDLPKAPKNLLSPALLSRYPRASEELLKAETKALAELPIDHQVKVTRTAGGSLAAKERLTRFLRTSLMRYDEERNDPDNQATSGLSPYLHFGHISSHEIFAEIEKMERWGPEKTKKAGGKREGFWGMSPPTEAFLDQLITWREIGLNMCVEMPEQYADYTSLPDWAKKTLAAHANDKRSVLYTRDEMENAKTGDQVWNAAQRELVREGRIHNYLRMLWGKRVLEWTQSPEEAVDVLIELNDKYALDGRDPNSYSGIFWTFGRYDRPWGPERPVYGSVRYMSSANTMKKLELERYLREYAR